MKSVMAHNFSNTPPIETPRSLFDRSCGYKTTMNHGWLIPFFIDDVLPGDTFNLNAAAFGRVNTLLNPILDNIFIDTHFFFIPYRLVWNNSRKFFGERVNPADSIDYTLPKFNSFQAGALTLHDYMGLPVGKDLTPVSLYHRGYNLVYNEYFRDQNLQNSVTVDLGDGPDNSANYTLKRRGKRHDYFTSCLPWPQKGNAVSLPLGTTAPVTITPNQANVSPSFNIGGGAQRNLTFTNLSSTVNWNAAGTATGNALWLDPNLTGTANLASATAATINDLRQAFQVQKLLERDARGGTRYSEVVANHFGVQFNDLTYRPEYLGGGTSPLSVQQVAATNTNVGASLTLGDLGGTGTFAFKNHGFTKSFNEHGFVLGLVSTRADLTYQQGMHRRFLKSTRYDIYWPSLAHLGEQAITNAEIYYQGLAADSNVFGYQERHAEYRYMPSQITGMLRSSYFTPLDTWHLSQNFSVLPTLGDTFIVEDAPLSRVVATPTEHHYLLDIYINLKCARPMPVFAVPGYIDHF